MSGLMDLLVNVSCPIMKFTRKTLSTGKYKTSRLRRWILAHLDYAGDDCLKWPFSRDTQGRGQIGFKNSLYGVSRVICEITHGPAPSAEHHAAHECGMGHEACANHRHIVWKTPSENQLDKNIHGTMGRPRGPVSHLPLEAIADIRANRGILTYKELCARHGLGRSTVKYWITTDHKPNMPGTSVNTINRRKRQLRMVKNS